MKSSSHAGGNQHPSAPRAGEAGLRLGELIAAPEGPRPPRSLRPHQGQRTLPKGGEPRTVPMSSRLFEALQARASARPTPSPT